MADAAAAIDRLAQAHDEGHRLVEQVMDQPKPDAVALAYVHSNEVAYSFYTCVKQLMFHDLQHNRRIYGRADSGGEIAMRTNAGQLTSARNQAVQHLLESDVPWLLWLDSDMGFQPDLLERLMEHADPIERPIVGALCFGSREVGSDGMGGFHTVPVPTLYDWAPVGDLEGFEIRFDYPANTLIRVGGTGAAAILVHRGVFERIYAKYGAEWYHRVPANQGSMGEDLSFCMRATALDIPIHVHTGVRTTHMKPQWLTESHFLDLSGAPPATEEVAVLVPVLGRPEHAEPFMASLRASTGLATAYAIADYDDTETMAAWKAAGARVIEHDAVTFAKKVNLGYRATGDQRGAGRGQPEPWLLLVGSDVHFYPGWFDQALAVAADRYHVIGTNDLGNPRVLAGEHATHPLIRRSYVDEVGASWDGPGIVAHEGYRHWFVDDEIVTAAKQRGVWAAALASKVEHLHPLFGKAEQDEVYELGQSHIDADRTLWEQRRERFA